MSWAVKLVHQICKVFSTAPEKFRFIQQLENMFSEVTREVFEFSVAGGQQQFVTHDFTHGWDKDTVVRQQNSCNDLKMIKWLFWHHVALIQCFTVLVMARFRCFPPPVRLIQMNSSLSGWSLSWSFKTEETNTSRFCVFRLVRVPTQCHGHKWQEIWKEWNLSCVPREPSQQQGDLPVPVYPPGLQCSLPHQTTPHVSQISIRFR